MGVEWALDVSLEQFHDPFGESCFVLFVLQLGPLLHSLKCLTFP